MHVLLTWDKVKKPKESCNSWWKNRDWLLEYWLLGVRGDYLHLHHGTIRISHHHGLPLHLHQTHILIASSVFLYLFLSCTPGLSPLLHMYPHVAQVAPGNLPLPLTHPLILGGRNCLFTRQVKGRGTGYSIIQDTPIRHYKLWILFWEILKNVNRFILF